MENNLTFNELKEIAKKISFEDDRIERLYIEQLENQSMSSTVDFFNILFLIKDFSVDDDIFDVVGNFGEVSAMFSVEDNENFIEYNVMYENFVQAVFRLVTVENAVYLREFSDKYICVLNKNEDKKADVFIDRNINKIKETEFLTNTCQFFWYAVKFAKKLSSKEILNISYEYRKLMGLLDEHLKHFVLSENKYLIDLGKDNKLVFNYVETEIFEKYLLCYSKLELENLWVALFNMCALFRKLSLRIAINQRFEYAKELDRDTITFLRELRQKANV